MSSFLLSFLSTELNSDPATNRYVKPFILLINIIVISLATSLANILTRSKKETSDKQQSKDLKPTTNNNSDSTGDITEYRGDPLDWTIVAADYKEELSTKLNFRLLKAHLSRIFMSFST